MSVFKKLFWLKISVLTLIFIIVCGIFYHFFADTSWFPWVIAVLSSIFTSFLVSVFFQFALKDEISKEHLSIMEYLNEKNKSGIIKYYGSFKDCIESIKYEFRESKNIDIYLMYGYTIFNNLSQEINRKLMDKNSVINIYMIAPENVFVSSYSSHWYNDNGEKLKSKINESKEFLLSKVKELKKRNEINGELNIFENTKNPINYSFYLFDKKAFYVPSKNVTTKEFVPLTLEAEKTSDPEALYNKISTELNMMKNDHCFLKISIDE
ncbi:MAG: hypothetical protein V7655_09305 [Aequorivita antarctica]